MGKPNAQMINVMKPSMRPANRAGNPKMNGISMTYVTQAWGPGATMELRSAGNIEMATKSRKWRHPHWTKKTV